MNPSIMSSTFENSTEQKREQVKELGKEKEKNSKILENLDFLIQQDISSTENTAVYEKRYSEIREKIERILESIKTLNFERGVDNYIKTRLAGKFLKDIPFAENLHNDLDSYIADLYAKIGPHENQYGTDSSRQYYEISKELDVALSSVESEIKKQQDIVEKLQDLLSADQEFAEAYIDPLNNASEALDARMAQRNILRINKALELLSETTQHARYLPELEKIRNELLKSGRTEQQISTLQWEMLPAGEGSPRNGNGSKETRHRETYIDEERIAFIENLKPEKIFISRNGSEGNGDKNEYRAYVFEKLVIIASPWSNNALYVLPRTENWQELARETKGSLRDMGCVRIMRTDSWQQRLTDLMASDPFQHYTEEIVSMEKWLQNKEKFCDLIKKYILKKFPEIDGAMQSGNSEQAHELIAKLQHSDFPPNIIQMIVRHFSNLKELYAEIFPEFSFTAKELRMKKYHWKNRPLEEKIDNIRDAIFSNYPEIEKAVEEKDYPTAAEWFSQFNTEEFYKIGLKYIVDGKDQELPNKEAIIKALMPEMPESELKLAKKGGRTVFSSIEDKKASWSQKYRNVVLENIPGTKELIADGQFEKAREIIMGHLLEFGSSNFVNKHLKSITGSGLFNKQIDMLKGALPEINWPDNLPYSKSGSRKRNVPKTTPEDVLSNLSATERNYRDTILKNIGGVREFLERRDYDNAKLIILKKLREEGVKNFIEQHMGASALQIYTGHQINHLKKAFPEIEWPLTNPFVGRRPGKKI
ncbi:MAG TPA: hypothetical protein VF817_03890 [Patescibacteria group bacterium]